MPESFSRLSTQAKNIFWNQPTYRDDLTEEERQTDIYAACWIAVGKASYVEVCKAALEAALENKPFPSRRGRFDDSDWKRLLEDALIVTLQAELQRDAEIVAKEQEERMRK